MEQPKALRIPFFGGMVPRAGRRQLKDFQAQVASNARLTSGQLEPLNDIHLTKDPSVAGLRSIFKIHQEGVDYWLGWSLEVDAVKGPIAGDKTNRSYFTGDGEPRVTDFSLATTGGAPYPKAWYVLGVTPPVIAASLSHAVGTGAVVSRSFVYTFVTPWGEESAPSPATTVVNGKTDGTWTIGATTAMNVAPPNSYAISAAAWAGGILTLTVAATFGLRAGEEVTLSGLAPASLNAKWPVATASGVTVTIKMADPGVITDQVGLATRVAPHNTTGMTKNIYWTETSGGVTEYRLVKSGVAVADASTTVNGDALSGEVLPSKDWPMPPVDAKGLILHPSGAFVAFAKNELLFSEPYKPYAWPDAYRLTAKHDIVGLGIFGTTIVVTTQGHPEIATGVDPAAMTMADVKHPWPCLVKSSIVSLGDGVMYAAPQGLARIGLQGSGLLTQDLYTEKEWKALNPSSFRSAPFDNRYVASYDPGDGNRQVLVIDPAEFATVVKVNKQTDALFGDEQTGKLHVITSNKIYEWDSDEASRLFFDWMSKEIVSPEVFNPGAAKVDADFDLSPEEQAALTAAREVVIAANQAIINSISYDIDGSMSAGGEIEIGGVSFDEAPSDSPNQLQFQIWINNRLKFTKHVTSSRAFRLPAGYKADSVAVRITGNVKVLAVVVADSMDSLRHA